MGIYYLYHFGSATEHIEISVEFGYYVIPTFSSEVDVLVYWMVKHKKFPKLFAQNFPFDFSSCYKTGGKSLFILVNWLIPVGRAPDKFAKKCSYFIVINTSFTNIKKKMQYFMIDAPDKFLHQATQTSEEDTEFEKKTNNKKLSEEITSLKKQLQEKDKKISELEIQLAMEKNKSFDVRNEFLKERKNMSEENILLNNILRKSEEKYKNLEKELKATQLELGQISVEKDFKMNLKKKDKIFESLFHSKPSTSSALNIQKNNSHFYPMTSIKSDAQTNSAQLANEKKILSALASPSEEQSAGACGVSIETNLCQGHEQNKELEIQNRNQDISLRPNNDVSSDIPPLPIEVHERRNAQPLSFINETSSSVNAYVYNAYKMLLVSISVMLLDSDIIKLKQWANEKFSVDNNLSVLKIILQLDQKGAINASDLSQLRSFFESITRFDLLYLIDEFLNGDYDKLKKLISQHKSTNNNPRGRANLNRVDTARVLLPDNNTPRSPLRSNAVDQASNIEAFERPTRTDENSGISILRNRERTENVPPSNVASTSVAAINGNRVLTHEDSENETNDAAVNGTGGNRDAEKRVSTSGAAITARKISGSEMSDSMQHSFQRRPKSAGESSSHDAQTSAAKYNGPSQSHPGHHHFHGRKIGRKQDIWLCSHYKRRCLVKFECCDKYWPCHRCHNNQSSCGEKKLKSRDTTMIKCVECGKEQEFGQFCVSCNTQFANFYCGQCKHLTGHDDHPYHCDKCGICRIHGDRSFHCDVCGICLDVQLRGNHKCRAGSAHDECGICLEDAFTGCQILPCSHKVHKECANRMIRNGITRCPICRESFAHKLERRPVGRKKR